MNEIHSRGDLNLFRVLLAVADTGSTIEAGVQLNLSQSAVSHALRRLRDMLGDPLFVKNGRQLVMTAHTRSILPKVRSALEDLSSATLRNTPFDPTRSAMTFQCGLRDALEYLIMPALMHRARQEHWQVRFHSQRVSGEDIEARILSGALDMAVSLEYPAGEQIASRELLREELSVMVGPSHPAYASGKLSLEDYVNSAHVLVTLNERERGLVDQDLVGFGGNQRHIALHCEHYHAAAQVVAETDLLLTMPRTYARSLAQLNGNRLLTVPFACRTVPIRLYWRKSLSEEPYMIWLMNELESLLRSMQSQAHPL
ncbi:LysR family transcriptional regulator [Halopseudomonas laoshanensis]|uniref:LysR family transcriptional regulator n=1 Tax=Halopseudomonas laoshanensis TaxID=2268758 RepID=A0A7V7GVS5_9GAMM|nr:LysR family transcriptional regulator [Halopseudomonas laoshanensis]KAA0695880.1 LysR family transcriptional regulator [Halopseudomonas laoshanensis]